MRLTLDHTQRLNLHALLGAQRADVGSIRAIWAIQDKLALTEHEERTIGLRRDLVSGQERILWDPSLSIDPKTFEFSDAEVARIRTAIEMWDRYSASSDRRWLEPLLHTLLLT